MIASCRDGMRCKTGTVAEYVGNAARHPLPAWHECNYSEPEDQIVR